MNPTRVESRMKKLTALLSLSVVASASAQTPTWSDDVACIVYSHCAPCHHEGGPGHFNLTSYVDGYWWRNEMRAATQARFMPPWPPDPAYRSFAHERVLSQAEIDIIAAWVDGGSPEGNAQNAPPPPVFASESAIPDPEITAIMEDYMVPSSTSDLYRCFVLPIDNPTDRWITGLEVVPGNTAMVHHVLVFQDNTGQAQQLDAQDPAPGYTSFGGIGVNGAKLIGAWVPGSMPYFTPPGMGIKLLANADLVIQVHYPATSAPELDSTRVNIRLGTSPVMRNLAIDPILNHATSMTDGPLVIPANQVRSFHQQYTLPINGTITAIAPHAHLICTSMKAWAVKPGNIMVPLIDIPHWNFAWQGSYSFRRPIYLPAGTVLHSEAVYDNTDANPRNPNSPPVIVTVGEATTDEMMLYYFTWTAGFPSDENIVVDDSPHMAHHMDCDPSFPVGFAEHSSMGQWSVTPSLATNRLTVTGGAPGTALRLMDGTGRLARTERISSDRQDIDVSGLARGLYTALLTVADGREAKAKVLLE